MQIKYAISMGGVGVSLLHNEDNTQELDVYDTEEAAQTEIDDVAQEGCGVEDWFTFEVTQRSDGDWYDTNGLNISEVARKQ